MAIDTSWSSVSLLCPFDTDLLDIKGHAITVGGGAVLSAAHAPTGCTHSLYLDGNNDWLSFSHADFAFGTGDFAIEIPLYRAGDTTVGGSPATGVDAAILDMRTSDSSYQISLFLQGSTSTNALKVLLYINGAAVIVSTTSMTTSFKLITLARVSGVTRLFIDGVKEGSNYTDTNNYTATFGRIGGRYTPVSSEYRSLNGYIGPIRFTKGDARGYSATFTPPTLPHVRPTISGHVYDAAAAPVAKTILVRDRSTGLYLGGANSDPSTGLYTFYPPDFGEVIVERIDELADPVTDEAVFDLDPSRGVIGGTLTTDTRGRLLTWFNEARVGAGGTYFDFDGSADYVQSTNALFALGTDDFCIDIEFYLISGGRLAGSYNRILQIGPDTTAGTLTIYCNATDNPTRITVQFYDTSWHTVVWSDPTTYANSTWHKMQLRRVSGVFTLTINDTLVATSAATAYNITGTLLSIGSNTSGTESFYGRLGKIRISRGARRAAAATPTSRLLKMPADGGSGENALVYDRVIPGG